MMGVRPGSPPGNCVGGKPETGGEPTVRAMLPTSGDVGGLITGLEGADVPPEGQLVRKSASSACGARRRLAHKMIKTRRTINSSAAIPMRAAGRGFSLTKINNLSIKPGGGGVGVGCGVSVGPGLVGFGVVVGVAGVGVTSNVYFTSE